MLYAWTESSLISSLPLSISPSVSATPYLPRSLWITLCLPASPHKCEDRENEREGGGGENQRESYLPLIG